MKHFIGIWCASLFFWVWVATRREGDPLKHPASSVLFATTVMALAIWGIFF